LDQLTYAHAQSDEERGDLNFDREEQLAAFCRARLDRITQRTLRSGARFDPRYSVGHFSF
jgi:hypothetical protein